MIVFYCICEREELGIVMDPWTVWLADVAMGSGRGLGGREDVGWRRKHVEGGRGCGRGTKMETVAPWYQPGTQSYKLTY